MPTGVYKRTPEMYISRKGRTPWNKGKYGMKYPNRKSYSPTLKHREKISKSLKGKYIGEKSWAWKGGKSSQNEIERKNANFRIWRNRVYKKDNYTCQLCEIRGGHGKKVILHPHHIKPFSLYPQLRYVVNNGITLCKDCHKKVHKKIGLLGYPPIIKL